MPQRFEPSLVLRQELKKKISVPPAQSADLDGEMLFLKKISKQDIFPYFFWCANHTDLREKDDIALKRNYAPVNTTLYGLSFGIMALSCFKY